MLNKDEPPSCFGSLWDPKESECSGGTDPAYTHPKTGLHYRDPCDYYESCGSRAQAAKAGRLIPAQNLTSRSHPMHPQPPVTPQYPQSYQSAPPQNSSYQQMVPVNYAMPQYLTVREPINSANRGKRLMIEVGRSMLKSIGHTFANFFDSESFTSPPAPPPPPPQPMPKEPQKK